MWIGCTITAIGFITKGALQLSTGAFVKQRVRSFRLQGTFNRSSSFGVVKHIRIANFKIPLSTMADSTGNSEAGDETVKELTAKQLKKQAKKDAKKAKFEKKMEGVKQNSAEVYHYYTFLYIINFFDDRKQTKKPRRRLKRRL